MKEKVNNITVEQIRKAGWGLGALSLLGVLVFPFVGGSGMIRILTLAFIWSGFAAAWNLFSGFSGYFSFGHSIFFGAGGFTSTMLLSWYNISPWIGMIVGALVAVVIAVILGLVLFRLGDFYFALAMLCVPLSLVPVIIWSGIIEVPVPFLPDQTHAYMNYRGITPYYYLALVAMLITTAVSWVVKNSWLGFYLRAIKGSEEAAQSLGINTRKHNIYALSISAFLSAIFGTLYVQVIFVMTPDAVFGLHPIVFSVVLPVAGGLGTVLGPIVGGMTLYPLLEILRGNVGHIIPGIHEFFFGVIIIFVILVLPEGIYTSARERLYAWARQAEQAESATAVADGGSEPETGGENR